MVFSTTYRIQETQILITNIPPHVLLWHNTVLTYIHHNTNRIYSLHIYISISERKVKIDKLPTHKHIKLASSPEPHSMCI